MGDAVDLSAFVPNDSAVLEILGNGVPTGWKIELAGPSHPKTVEVANEAMRERLQKEKAVEFAQVNGRKYKVDDESPDERAHRNVSRLVKRILGWSPNPVFKNIGDEPIVFSEEAATKLLLRPDMSWVLAQIADYVMSETAFTQRSVPT